MDFRNKVSTNNHYKVYSIAARGVLVFNIIRIAQQTLYTFQQKTKVRNYNGEGGEYFPIVQKNICRNRRRANPTLKTTAVSNYTKQRRYLNSSNIS